MISKTYEEGTTEVKDKGRKKETPKWKRQRVSRPKINQQARRLEAEMRKSQLIEVMVENASLMEIMDGGKKGNNMGQKEHKQLTTNQSNGFGVDCNGQGNDRARGLMILWRDTVDISIISYSLNHIGGGTFVDESGGSIVAFASFYGHPEEHKKNTLLACVKGLEASKRLMDLNRMRVLNGKLNKELKVDETIWRQHRHKGASAICEVVKDGLTDKHILWCARYFDKLEIRDAIQ
ncbi:hypothetical protein KIW84_024755 [Lathyrus oleraceus]|uniref:Uncharacterized protein n=1 Tax=Pisum sativum TaxID=3888 RepID=A0A9D4YGG2_PEA|nr:hypothetical protein KIW84_024755 [Pisum sativum]